EDGIRDFHVTGVQTCALPIYLLSWDTDRQELRRVSPPIPTSFMRLRSQTFMTKILFASNSEHKLSEVRSILGPDFRILSLAEVGLYEDIPETQDTIEGNAEQKARYVFERQRMPCLADDSGLEVNALDGEPGVRSARYAGEHGN